MLRFRIKKQSIMVSMDDLEELGRSSSVVISLFNDRMKSSMQRGDQFKDEDGYYIIYTINELSERLNCANSTISAILTDLKSKGYIITKQVGLNRPNKIYLPKFFDNFEALDDEKNADKVSNDDGHPKIGSQEIQKSSTNQSKNKQSNVIKNTSNTINTAHKEKSENRKITLTPIKRWKMAAKGKLHLDDDVINAINYVSNGDAKRCYKLTGIMNNAKWHVIKEYGLQNNPKAKLITRYENNVNLKTKLCDRIMYIATKLPDDETEQAKYWTTAFIDYFKWAFGLVDYSLDLDPSMGNYSRYDKYRYEQELRQSERDMNRQLGIPDGPEIPMFKIK